MIMTCSAVQLSVRTILATCKRSVKVVLHILRSILLPAPLLQQLLMPGLKFQEEEGGEGVRHRAIELLDILLAHADQFITHVVDSDVIGNSSSLRAALLKETRFLLRSERLPGLPLLLSLWRTEIAAAKQQQPQRPHFAAHLLRILRVLSSVRFAAELNVAALMADIESLAGSGMEKEAVEALQLEALLLLTDLVKKAEEDHHHKEAEDEEAVTSKIPPMVASSFFLLQDSLTEETFAILLANILDGGAAVRKQEVTTTTIDGGAAVRMEDDTATGDGGAAVRNEDDDITTIDGGAAVRKREASREILRVVMRQSGAGLQEGTDLQLVLDLCPALHSPQFRAQIARAMLR
jgi:hypothetical protein